MTEDGSKVFFTTKDALPPPPTRTPTTAPTSIEAEVTVMLANISQLTRISTGIDGTGNTDACDPVSNSNGPHWNTIGSELKLRRGRDRRRWRSGLRRWLDLLPLPREARRPLQRHREPAQPLPRSSRPSRRASSPPSTPKTRRCSTRSRKPKRARPPTSRSTHRANLRPSPRPSR